ncbi:MAG: phosphoribosyltransferase [Legionella sp.]|jgi:predicted phosphoribosyltransferase
MQQYYDRVDAGKVLAHYLKNFTKNPNTLILALPRGGVPVAYEVATKLHLPLDVFIVRKLGIPGHEELAMGALASGNTVFFNQDIINVSAISQATIDKVIQAEQLELERRELAYRGHRPFPKLENKTVILIDDGIATGATMNVAATSITKMKPGRLIIAVPVAALSTCKEMKLLGYELICPLQPINFNSVGSWYELFPQTTDEEVITLLRKADMLISQQYK